MVASQASQSPLSPRGYLGRDSWQSLEHLAHLSFHKPGDLLPLPLPLALAPLQSLLPVLCAAAEFGELPVRHNEDKLNVALSQQVRWGVDTRTAGGSGRPGAATGTRLTAWVQRRRVFCKFTSSSAADD